MDKINVLMVGSKTDVKGGMTSVVNSFMNNNFSDDIKIYFIPTHISGRNIIKILYFTFAIIKIIYILIFKHIDIIHIHFSERGSFYRKYFIFNIGKLLKKKIIVHMHGAEFKEFYYKRNKFIKKHIIRFLRDSDKVLVLGKSWQEYIKKIDSNINLMILHNSINLKNKTVVYDNKNVNILFLAVLMKRKGIFDLIKAAKKIINDKSLNYYNIKFIVAGDGKEKRKVINMVNDLKLNSYFDFKGWVTGNEKEELIRKSQIFVLPSYNEGLPMSLLEAMSYGLPVITTNVGSIEDLVKNNTNGYIIEPGDIQEIYEKMKNLIVDTKTYKKMSKNSYETIKQEFSDIEYFKKVEKLYRELSKNNK